MKKKTCEKCGTEIAYPAGVCLPTRQPDEDESLKQADTLQALFQHGLQGAILERRFGYFECDQCVSKLHAQHGVSPDPVELDMARNRALYLWDTEIWEKKMRPDEFPPSPQLPDLSLFDEWLGNKIRAILPSCKTERDQIALYTNAMARQLRFRQRSRLGLRGGSSGRQDMKYIAVTAESAFGDVTGLFFDGFTNRWLLKDVGKETAIYSSVYDFPHWISYAMAPHLAVNISLNLPGRGGEPANQNISWECYINTRGGRCMVVFGAA